PKARAAAAERGYRAVVEHWSESAVLPRYMDVVARAAASKDTPAHRAVREAPSLAPSAMARGAWTRSTAMRAASESGKLKRLRGAPRTRIDARHPDLPFDRRFGLTDLDRCAQLRTPRRVPRLGRRARRAAGSDPVGGRRRGRDHLRRRRAELRG